MGLKFFGLEVASSFVGCAGMECPQETNLLVESADEVQSAAPVRWGKLQRVAAGCGCAALVLAGYALGRHRTSSVSDQAIISEIGAIQGQADFKTLYNQVMKTGLTEAQKSAINDQIVDNTATVTNANVKLLQTWYHAATKSNKLFANKMIIASLSTPAKTTAATTSAKCPISTYAEFG